MAGLEVRFVLQAMNADVIKTYVRMGIGVGIIASVAFDESIDSDQVAIEVKHLLALNTTRVAIKRSTYLRGFAYDFTETFAPTLSNQHTGRDPQTFLQDTFLRCRQT